MKPEHKEMISRCVNEMRKAVKPDGYKAKGGLVHVKRSGTQVTYMAVIDTKGHVTHHSSQVCHAGLSYPFGYYNEGGQVPLFVVSRIQGKYSGAGCRNSTEIEVAFFKWLTTHSPYRSVFVKRGGKAVRKLGFLVARCDIPSNLLAGAMIAHRMVSEAPWIVNLWYRLVQEGVHPNLAFIHAHQAKTIKGFDEFVVAAYGGHRALGGDCFTKRMAINFKNGVMVNPKPNYNILFSYHGVHKLWGGIQGGGSYLEKALLKLVQDVKVGLVNDGTVKKVVNPFNAEPLADKSAPTDIVCREWAKLLKKEYANDA